MPELPDVEIFKRYLNATSLYQKIEDVCVNNTKVLKSISPEKLKSQLKNRSFESTMRYGKYLFAETDKDFCLMLHFGMTGSLKYFKNENRDIEYVRVLFSFTNGYHLAYISQRMLGKVGVTPSVEIFIEKQKWGPDALKMDYETFEGVIGKSRGAVKSTLMNQKLVAGIGNIYSDEILFQSKIHPKTPVDKLNQCRVKYLFGNMKKVLTKAVRWHADPREFPDTYLLPCRDKENKCPLCGTEIKTVKVSGRTAYFCPKCQTK